LQQAFEGKLQQTYEGKLQQAYEGKLQQASKGKLQQAFEGKNFYFILTCPCICKHICLKDIEVYI
jgi:hypothetical protein